MKKVEKKGIIREVRDEQVNRHINNGWLVIDDEKLVVKKASPKKDAEDTPAVEEVSSEQGDITDEEKGDEL